MPLLIVGNEVSGTTTIFQIDGPGPAEISTEGTGGAAFRSPHQRVSIFEKCPSPDLVFGEWT